MQNGTDNREEYGGLRRVRQARYTLVTPEALSEVSKLPVGGGELE